MGYGFKRYRLHLDGLACWAFTERKAFGQTFPK
jgi:hypothetical protein